MEQALALCKELDESYTELNEWMDGLENELHNCESITTGMSPKLLFQQQQHNSVSNNNKFISINRNKIIF